MSRRLVRILSSDEIVSWALGVGFVLLVIGTVTLHAMGRPSPLDQHVTVLIGGILGYLSRAQSLPAHQPTLTPTRKKDQGEE